MAARNVHAARKTAARSEERRRGYTARRRGALDPRLLGGEELRRGFYCVDEGRREEGSAWQ